MCACGAVALSCARGAAEPSRRKRGRAAASPACSARAARARCNGGRGPRPSGDGRRRRSDAERREQRRRAFGLVAALAARAVGSLDAHRGGGASRWACACAGLALSCVRGPAGSPCVRPATARCGARCRASQRGRGVAPPLPAGRVGRLGQLQARFESCHPLHTRLAGGEERAGALRGKADKAHAAAEAAEAEAQAADARLCVADAEAGAADEALRPLCAEGLKQDSAPLPGLATRAGGAAIVALLQAARAQLAKQAAASVPPPSAPPVGGASRCWPMQLDGAPVSVAPASPAPVPDKSWTSDPMSLDKSGRIVHRVE